jgi:hypothetical protein
VKNTEVFDILWGWVKMELTTGVLNNQFILVKDDTERTAWHVAAKVGNSEVIQKLWECAEEKLTSNKLKLWLAKDDRECTDWHVAE